MNCITNRTEIITSNTKTFKFSTTHSIFLIISLIKNIINTTTFSSFSYFSNITVLINFISSINNIIKIRTRKNFFKVLFIRKNIKHTIKNFIISSISCILFWSIILIIFMLLYFTIFSNIS